MKKISFIIAIIVFISNLSHSVENNNSYDYGFKMYKSGYYQKALEIWMPLANDGNVEAQHMIGMIYVSDQSAMKDYSKAMIWFRKAAQHGYVSSQYMIGYMYEFGQNGRPDYSKALKWYLKAAENGDTYSQYKTGMLYFNGFMIKKDLSKAYKWLKKAAEKGEHHAQYKLGNMYADGVYVKQDKNEARIWFRKAADQGNLSAKKALGKKIRCVIHVYGDTPYKGEGCELKLMIRHDIDSTKIDNIARWNLGDIVIFDKLGRISKKYNIKDRSIYSVNGYDNISKQYEFHYIRKIGPKENIRDIINYYSDASNQ